MRATTINWLCGLIPGTALGFGIGMIIAQREIAFLNRKILELLEILQRAIELIG